MARQKVKPNVPFNWISAVARSYQQKAPHSLNGKEGGHSTKAKNPHGHSPSQELPNLTHIEQVEYLAKEIMKFSKTYDPAKIYSPDAHMNEYLHKIANNSIASMQREVDELLAAFDDPTHACFDGCVEKSLFLRPASKQANEPDYSRPTTDKQYEQHLDEISQDKSDPARYKELVRKYDYGRTARRS